MDQTRELTEAEEHMKEALKQFEAAEAAGADPSNITDNYLDPLNLKFEEPDFAKLEKPPKPPVPEVVTPIVVSTQNFVIFCFLLAPAYERINVGQRSFRQGSWTLTHPGTTPKDPRMGHERCIRRGFRLPLWRK